MYRSKGLLDVPPHSIYFFAGGYVPVCRGPIRRGKLQERNWRPEPSLAGVAEAVTDASTNTSFNIFLQLFLCQFVPINSLIS